MGVSIRHTATTREDYGVSQEEILKKIGEDPQREGLIDTPERVRKSYEYLMQGYKQNPNDILKSAIFHEECNHMIIVRDIELYSDSYRFSQKVQIHREFLVRP